MRDRKRGQLIAFVRAELGRDVPLVPATWRVSPIANRWAAIDPPGAREPFLARLIMRSGANPDRALLVCIGEPVTLAFLASTIAADALPWTQTWPDLDALLEDTRPGVVALRGTWPDERHPAAPGGTPLIGIHTHVAGWLGDTARRA